MTDLNATLKVVIDFLRAHHYDTQEAVEGVKNGRWIHDWCVAATEKAACPTGEKAALKELFKLLEAGYHGDGEPAMMGDSNWTRAFTNSALRKGGYKEWSEEKKKKRRQ